MLVVAAVVLIAGCGGNGNATASHTAAAQAQASASKLAGLAATPVKPAPPLALRDSLGHAVNIDEYRGKAVLVTFIYDHCPDVCPLIVSHLHAAQQELGPQARKLQIIAVSVDPRGDTPKTVNAFLRAHEMTGRMDYLIGSRPRLEKVWSEWNIVSKSSSTRNNPELVEHSALIYGIDAAGDIKVLYPPSFQPQQIVHDVPILASG